MEVPTTVNALWSQRKRWARGQGEVLHKYLTATFCWRHHQMWLLSFEAVLSLLLGGRSGSADLRILRGPATTVATPANEYPR